jgi:hypothetical protein
MYGTLESVPNVCTILTRGLPFTYAAYLAFFDRKFSPANLHFHFYGVCSGCRTIYTTLSILIHTFAISSYLSLVSFVTSILGQYSVYEAMGLTLIERIHMSKAWDCGGDPQTCRVVED